MPRKVFQVQVELIIQAVSCPGVWLCPSGDVSLQLFMLDSCVQTKAVEPTFPLFYHEKFIFYKVFCKARRLSELQRVLNNEIIYAELIQWKDRETGNVLASFESSLGDLLYPTSFEGSVAGVDIDLLMEPTRCFPGIIAPKMEVSTKTTIEETVSRGEYRRCTAFVVNPKTIVSQMASCKPVNPHQRKVCHSVRYHRFGKGHPCGNFVKKPPFVVGAHVDENLIGRKRVDMGGGEEKLRSRSLDDRYFFCNEPACPAHNGKKTTRSKISDELVVPYSPRTKFCRSRSPVRKHKCYKCFGKTHVEPDCHLCTKYRSVFNRMGPPCGKNTSLRHGTCPCNIIASTGGAMNKISARDGAGQRLSDLKKKIGAEFVPRIGDGKLANLDTYCFDDSDCTSTVRSLAARLHEKLRNTLRHTSDICGADFQDFGPGCPCTESGTIEQKKDYYDNLEKFYTQMLGKSHAKSSRRPCRCSPVFS